MAKKNFYAVRAGRTPGIYLTWDEAKAQVHGFAGAAYKGFATKEEAEAFMAGGTLSDGGTERVPNRPDADGGTERVPNRPDADVGTERVSDRPDADGEAERVLNRPDAGTGSWTQSWSGDRGTSGTGKWKQNHVGNGEVPRNGAWTQNWPSGSRTTHVTQTGASYGGGFAMDAGTKAHGSEKVDGHVGVSREMALSNLKKVVVARDVGAHVSLLNGVFEKLCETEVPLTDLEEREACERLGTRYGMRIGDGSLFLSHPDADVIAFVDGGGDKSGSNFASSRLPFGVVFFEKGEAFPRLFRYVFTKGTDGRGENPEGAPFGREDGSVSAENGLASVGDEGAPFGREDGSVSAENGLASMGEEGAFDWIFHASNVSAEVIADLFVMYLCEKRGYRSVVIYQDNNLPAKYFSGEFKKIHNPEDYVLQSYVKEGIRHLSEGREIRFVYVPSEHSAKAKAKKEESYAAQGIERMPFEEAEFYNAVSDVLADYRW